MRSDGLSPQTPEALRRELDRVGAFSDGVFAVAITLLVLNIEVPDVDPGDLDSALGDLLPAIQAYFIAFLVIGLFWYGHHVAWSRFTRATPRLVFANLLLLSLIALMPFTTAMLGNFDNEPLPVAIYALNVGLAALADSFVDRVAWREGLTETTDPHEIRVQSIAGWVRPLVFFISIPLAWVSITVAQLFWLVLILTPRIARRLA